MKKPVAVLAQFHLSHLFSPSIFFSTRRLRKVGYQLESGLLGSLIVIFLRGDGTSVVVALAELHWLNFQTGSSSYQPTNRPMAR